MRSKQSSLVKYSVPSVVGCRFFFKTQNHKEMQMYYSEKRRLVGNLLVFLQEESQRTRAFSPTFSICSLCAICSKQKTTEVYGSYWELLGATILPQHPYLWVFCWCPLEHAHAHLGGHHWVNSEHPSSLRRTSSSRVLFLMSVGQCRESDVRKTISQWQCD